VTVSASPISSYVRLLIDSIVATILRRVSASIPGGLERYKTGSPSDRHCTPWNTEGKNPVPHAAFPALGKRPPEIKTTNPGRFSLSVPRPYVTHEPSEAYPKF
jgi:hypothetical protein